MKSPFSPVRVAGFFHLQLLQLCGNQELVNVIMDLRNRISSAPASQGLSRRRIDQSNREHFQMVEALEMKDTERLTAIVRAHIHLRSNEPITHASVLCRS
jgi:DNA-binding GntR family transcriptional regulator